MTEGTATTDIECEDCTGTTFSDVDDRSECQDWNTCPEGEGLLTTGSATTDITCEHCVEDDMQYSQEDDRSSCADHNKCPAGEGSDWDDLSPANQADSTCSACVEGETYSDSECYGACQDVTPCDATHYETAAPTVTSDRECTLNCPAGKYSEMLANGQGVMRRVCTECDAGWYSEDANQESCDGCPVDEVSTANSAECTGCDANTDTADQVNQTTCTPSKCHCEYSDKDEEEDCTADNAATWQQLNFTAACGPGQKHFTKDCLTCGPLNTEVDGIRQCGST